MNTKTVMPCRPPGPGSRAPDLLVSKPSPKRIPYYLCLAYSPSE
uniref:Uncharacterized protein n=1 Tax=Anguilla anguilla TaxID=7936 RepID=A0A0E9X061_ANGAN